MEVNLSEKVAHFILCSLFFLSGVSALIYQIMWQRLLYNFFGMDFTAVMLIVTVFMFGLGIGSLAGGYFAERCSSSLLQLYLLIELVIAAFGILSPTLMVKMGEFMVWQSYLLNFCELFLLLALPTMLMGATFPILVTQVNKFYKNIGIATANLYFANTLGGASGVYLAAFILLPIMGITAAIYHAAFLNLVVAFIVYLLFRD